MELFFPRRAPRDSEYEEQTKQALAEWQAAVNYFEAVSEPSLVEYATYEMEAARRKYEYLLRRARSERTNPREAQHP